ncbi:MAG: hypothetical protein AAFY64_10280, partial [Pseudomonadota bacterium]
IGLKVGDTITVRQAVAALVTKSANDVAAAVAIHIGGSEARFAKLMTRKARSIGMRKTRFRNASGLTDRLQKTTARDMITLALRLQDDFPTHFGKFRIRSFKWRGKRFGNHNTLLKSFYGTTGIKTGYTRASGFNLVSSVKRGRRHVVAAVFGGKSARARNARMRILLSRALKRASTRKTRRSKPLLVAQPRQVRRRPSLNLASTRKTQTMKRRVAPTLPKQKPVRVAKAQQDPRIHVSRTRRVLFRNSFPPGGSAKKPQDPNTRRKLARASTPSSIGELIGRVTPAPSQPRGTIRRAAQIASFEQQALDRLARGLPLRGINPTVPRPMIAKRPRLRSAVYSATPRRQQPNWQRRPNGSAGATVQVGAYLTSAEARSRLAAVRRNNTLLLTDAYDAPERAVVNGRTVYRAKFAGLSNSAANRACQTLIASGVQCLVSR